MDNTESPVTRLSVAECWERLRTQQLGRIVTHVREVIDIFPVNYAVDGEELVFRTAEGSKLLELTVNEDVIFEVDDHTDADAWSVIVRGTARRLESDEEIQRADALPLTPWVPTMKRNYVRITPRELSGRSFRREGEPPRDGVQMY